VATGSAILDVRRELRLTAGRRVAVAIRKTRLAHATRARAELAHAARLPAGPAVLLVPVDADTALIATDLPDPAGHAATAAHRRRDRRAGRSRTAAGFVARTEPPTLRRDVAAGALRVFAGLSQATAHCTATAVHGIRAQIEAALARTTGLGVAAKALHPQTSRTQTGSLLAALTTLARNGAATAVLAVAPGVDTQLITTGKSLFTGHTATKDGDILLQFLDVCHLEQRVLFGWRRR